MNIAPIRAAFETTLAAIPGLRVYPTVPDAPSVPCAIVIPETIRYAQTFDGSANIRFVIQVLAATINSQGGQTALDGYCADAGPTSIVEAVDNDPTLGGTVQLAQVTDMRAYGVIGDTVRYYSAELVVDVWAT